MEIYQATRKNLEEVTELFNLYREFYDQPSDSAGAITFIRERLEKKDSVIYVAAKEKRYVGFMQLYPLFSSLSMKRTWILNDLFVRSEARQKGVGQLLVDRAILLCKETDAISLSLQTAPDNHHARKLYEKNGFTLDKEYDSYVIHFR